MRKSEKDKDPFKKANNWFSLVTTWVGEYQLLVEFVNDLIAYFEGLKAVVMEKKVFLSIFICFVSISGWVYGQTVGDYRSNVTTGNWQAAGSWEICTSLTPETWTAASSAPTTAILTSGKTISIRSGHTITVAPNPAGTVATLNSTVVINSGGALIINNSNTSGADITIGATGTLTNNGSLTITGTSGTNAQLVISNTTAGAFTSTGSVTLNTGSNLRLSSGTTNISGSFANNGATGSFTSNNGTVQFSGTSTLSGSPLTNFSNIVVASGTLTTSLSTLNLSGNLTNSGTVNAQNTITVLGNFTNDGTVTAQATTISVAGSFVNNSTFNLGTSLINLNGTSDTNGFTNDGTFNAGTGTVTFSNTFNPQTIEGTSAIAFYDLTISNPNGVFVENTAELSGTLTLTDGSLFDADGSNDDQIFTIRSTGVSTGGRIAAIPDATFEGEITIERFINGPDSWRYLSVPITNATVNMWLDDFPITGSFSDRSPNGVDGVVNNTSPSIFFFNPATNAYVAVGGASTGGTALDNTVGYTAYSYKTGNFTIDMRGFVARGDIGVPVSTANGGYNLVPNPYPSAIDWDNVNRTGFADAMWVRVANNTYASYVGGLATNEPFTGWEGEVAIGQSFWVQSTSATSLDFTENAKTDGQYEFMREEPVRDYMRVTLVSPVIGGSVRSDDAVIRFREDALIGTDSKYDARKLKNDIVNLSSFITAASEDYAINAIPLIQCSQSVKLRVENTPAGNYTLKFSDLDKMDLGYTISLIDHFLNKEVIITNAASIYSFSVTSNAASKGAERFELKFSQGLVAPGITVSGNILSLDQPSGGNIQWYKDGILINGANAANLTVNETGIYKAAMTIDGCLLESDAIQFIVNGVESPASGLSFYPNPTSDYVNIRGLSGDVLVYVYDSQGRLITSDMQEKSINGSEGITLDLRHYKKGLYLVNLKQQGKVSQFKVLKK